MPIALLRVDERLIHGQVVVGWGGRLRVERIVVIDDELADSPWEQELYHLGVPPEISADFVTVADARERWSSWDKSSEQMILLLRGVPQLVQLAEDSFLAGVGVNLGGIHHAAGRARALPYLYLTPQEREELRQVERSGADLVARDLPTSRGVPLDELPG